LQKVSVGKYHFDKERFVLYDGDSALSMPKKQAELLALLLENRGEVVTTEEILEELYGERDLGTGALRVYINKLKQIFGKDAISNIRGVGYCFEK